MDPIVARIETERVPQPQATCPVVLPCRPVTRSPRNTKALIFIHVFLAIQVLAPLTYYGARADGNDERFAWRMFSSVRMVSCRVEFRTGADEQPVRDLHSVFHEAWIQLSKRGRLEVIEAMAHELCRRAPGGVDAEADAETLGTAPEVRPEVRVGITCTGVDGQTQKRGGSWNLCRLGSR